MANFTIYKGLHISHIFPRFYSDKSFIRFTVNFDNNCLYQLGNPDDSAINKLHGVGFGLIHSSSDWLQKIIPINAQSFRLGWNCASNNGKIQVYAYYYNDNIRKSEYLCDMDLKTNYDCYVYFDRVAQKIFVDITKDAFNLHVSYNYRFVDCPNWGFFCFPYFGGVEVAPHTMDVTVTEID